jgi:prevent-host-death family protein
VKTVDMAEATEALSTYARKVRREPLVVTRRGKPVLALMPLSDADRESLAVSTNPKFIAIMERSRARCKPGQGISTEEMRRRLALRRKAERKIS